VAGLDKQPSRKFRFPALVKAGGGAGFDDGRQGVQRSSPICRWISLISFMKN
jgi:hypothetical protein